MLTSFPWNYGIPLLRHPVRLFRPQAKNKKTETQNTPAPGHPARFAPGTS